MKSLWPGGIKTGRAAMCLLGIAGSMVGGVGTLLFLSYGRNYDYRYGIRDTTVAQADRIIGPSSWISLICAIAVAMLLIVLYRFLTREPE